MTKSIVTSHGFNVYAGIVNVYHCIASDGISVAVGYRAGTPEANDQYSVSINGNVVNYSVAPADTTLTAIRDKLITAINTDIDTGGIVTAAAGGGGRRG